MKETRDRAIAFTLSWESGYSNDPDDPGRETNFGISKRYHPDVDIKNLTKDRAISIYTVEYWDAMKCNDLPYPLDMIVFDSAVNPGIGATQKFLSETMDWKDVLFYRIQYFADRGKKNPQYLRGWINRCIGLWMVATK